uniref:G_PROTEIN_RECEP_F2_3 domain-containing protein n=1 Tax=Macrostomum lignano TaxID=282301 RepID=A0A1I8FDT5_9PLAT
SNAKALRQATPAQKDAAETPGVWFKAAHHLLKPGEETQSEAEQCDYKFIGYPLCLKVRPDVCGSPYTSTTYMAVIESVCLSVNRSHHLVTCGCAAVVATLCLSLVCLCVRRCGGSSGGGGARGTTNHKISRLQRLQRKTSNSDAELHVHVVSHPVSQHPTAETSTSRPICVLKLDKFSCCWGLVLTDRSSNQTQETCVILAVSAARMAAQRVLCLSCSSRRCTALDCRVSWCSNQLHQELLH